jgi:hypothetical protein
MNTSFFVTVVALAVTNFGMSPSGFAQQPTSTSIVGGRGGTQFSDTEIPPGVRVLEVHVFSGDFVDAVQMLYALADGRTLLSRRHGGPGGQPSAFRLDSDEYIVGLSGRYGAYIDSIRIHTNKRTSSFFGGSGGNRDYRIDIAPGNQAVGFAGRAGEYLDAIGLTFIPIMTQQAGQTRIFGGRGGSVFSDSDIPLGARISEVRVRAGRNIDSIQAVYTLQDGRLFEGPTHGGRGGRSMVFRLERDEYIIGLSGRCGNYIDSLSIRTNKRTSSIFGGSGGSSDFRIDVPAGYQAIGFVGRSGDYLDAIGLSYATNTPSRENRRRRPNRFRIQR